MNDARKGLSLSNGPALRTSKMEKPVAIKVPQFYYQAQNGAPLSAPPNFGMRPVGQGPPMGHRNPSMQHGSGLPFPMVSGTKPTYTPQDARSGLQQVPSFSVPANGSPEVRKMKKQRSPTKQTKNNSEAPHKAPNAIVAAEDIRPIASTDNKGEPCVEHTDVPPTPHVRPKNDDSLQKQSASAVAPESQVSTTEQHQDEKAFTSQVKQIVDVKQAISPVKQMPKLAVKGNHTEARNKSSVEDEHMTISPLALSPAKEPVTLPLSPSPKIVMPPVTDSTRSEPVPSDVDHDPAVTALVKQPLGDFEASEEAASDDEQKNDSSFHSAKEAQSDENETKEDAPTTQGTEVKTIATPVVAPTAVPEQTSSPVSTEPEARNEKVTEVSAPSSSAAPVSGQKKAGPKQQESLFPFKTKKDTKKEKEAKKKQQKKAAKIKKPDVASKPAETAVEVVKVKGSADGAAQIPVTVPSSDGNSEVCPSQQDVPKYVTEPLQVSAPVEVLVKPVSEVLESKPSEKPQLSSQPNVVAKSPAEALNPIASIESPSSTMVSSDNRLETTLTGAGSPAVPSKTNTPTDIQTRRPKASLTKVALPLSLGRHMASASRSSVATSSPERPVIREQGHQAQSSKSVSERFVRRC